MARNKKTEDRQIDWTAIEMQYRTSGVSVRNIAAQYGVTEGAIRQRAKKEGWERDLQEKVRVATEALLIRKGATQDVRTEQQAIEVEAEVRSNVVMQHRGDLKRLAALRDKMIQELEHCTDNLEEYEEMGEKFDTSGPAANGGWKVDKENQLYRKTISRSGRIDDLKTLVDLDEKLRKGQREAHGIGADDGNGKGSVEDRLRRLAGLDA